jgi:glycosyltransferase involved in cell wall biosynthesis
VNRLGAIGAVDFAQPIDARFGDAKTWRGLGRYFESIVVIAQTQRRRPSRVEVENITYVLLPRMPRAIDLWAFPLLAFLVAVWYRMRGVKTWTASDPLRAGLATVVLGLLPGISTIIQIQGQLLMTRGPRFGRRRRAIEALSRVVARRADLVRVVSKDIAAQSLAVGIPASRIAIVPSRCDTGYFAPERWRQAGQELRRSLGLLDAPIVGFLGSLNESKGIDVLLDATELSTVADMTLAIAGEGPLRDLVDDAQRRRGGRVRTLGQLHGDQVPAFLACLDVLLVPSYDEGLPRVVLEGMAMELPVVASDAGGISEVIEDGRTGLIAPAGDALAIADCLNGLLEDEALRRSLGNSARQEVQRNYEAEAGLRQFATALGAP